jgi:integrase
MAGGRPALRPGEWGKITFKQNKSKGSWTARAVYCDRDGVRRDWTASGRTRAAANEALLKKFGKGYAIANGPDEGLDGNSTIDQLYAFWWSENELGREHVGAYAHSTLVGYERIYRLHVKESLGRLRIGDVPVSRIDAHIKMLMETSLHNAKNARTVLRMMFEVAVRHDARDDGSNPVSKTLSVPVKKPEINVIEFTRVGALRRAVMIYDRTPKRGPKSPNPLLDLFDLLLVGLRIGEALAMTWTEVDFNFETPNGIKTAISVTGTLERKKGVGLYRKPVTKTKDGYRTIIVPDFVAEMLLRRFVNNPELNFNNAVFVSSRGHWMSPNNMRRTWRYFRDEAGFSDVTPHTFRRTAATLIDSTEGSQAASRLLGHADDSTTKNHYILRPSLAPDLSETLEQFRQM